MIRLIRKIIRMIRKLIGKHRSSRGNRDLEARAGRGGRRGQVAPPTSHAFAVQPRMTDHEIDNWRDEHYVAVDPTLPLKNKLLVFFCGSYGIPIRQRMIIHLAAQMGYHAINLSYPNSWTVGGLCAESDHLDCHEQVRLEIIDGVTRSGLVQIGRANSITNRLTKLLHFLQMEHGADGWSHYLCDGDINWGSIVVAGHSQGGGQAALLAKLHCVDRVLMLASPVDYVRRRRTHAAWLAKPGATPQDRFFGFAHTYDKGFDRIQEVWELLGMAAGGAVVNVDTEQPTYRNSQRLVTGLVDVPRDKYHGSAVQDGLTPTRPGGSPVFQPVWRYLLGG